MYDAATNDHRGGSGSSRKNTGCPQSSYLYSNKTTSSFKGYAIMVDRGRLGYLKDLSFVDPRIRSHDLLDSAFTEPLPEPYQPGNWDVLCSGGKESFDHIGNRRFRICIANNLGTYENAKSKHKKSMVVTSIVDSIKENSTQERGGFIRKDAPTGRWFEVEDKIAREKIGHALRDAIKLAKKQSGKNKWNLESAPAATVAHKRGRPNEFISIQWNFPSSAPTDSSSSRTAGLPSLRRGLVQNVLAKPVLITNDDKGSTMDEMFTLPDSTDDDWEKSLKESANKFSLSDAEDNDDEASQAGDYVLTKMALETSTSDEPDSLFETLNPVPLPVARQPSGRFGAPQPAQNKNAWGEPFDRSGVPPFLRGSVKHTDKLVWKPPGGSKTEHAYKAYLQSIQASSAIPNSSPHAKFPVKQKAFNVSPISGKAAVRTSFGSSFR